MPNEATRDWWYQRVLTAQRDWRKAGKLFRDLPDKLLFDLSLRDSDARWVIMIRESDMESWNVWAGRKGYHFEKGIRSEKELWLQDADDQILAHVFVLLPHETMEW